jgi:hypothetical protein
MCQRQIRARNDLGFSSYFFRIWQLAQLGSAMIGDFFGLNDQLIKLKQIALF